jgi:hypothetical protein
MLLFTGALLAIAVSLLMSWAKTVEELSKRPSL